MEEKEQLLESIDDWQGYNYFYWKGKILVGPAGLKPVLMTGTAILAPLGLFLAFNSKFYYEHLSLVIPLIAIVMTFITLYFMLLAAFSDPGILPRKIGKTPIDLKKRVMKMVQMGTIKKYRLCETCGIVRPSRSTHCADCNNCVERFDHHCPWIGNCAGRRNYKWFFIFLILLNLLTIYIGVFCIAHISIYVNDKVKVLNILQYVDALDDIDINEVAISFNDCIVSIFLIIYCALAMIFTFGLLIYHVELVSKNLTTKEELKHLFDNPFGNPYDKNNCMKNYLDVLAPKTPKESLLKKMEKLYKKKRKEPEKITDEVANNNVMQKVEEIPKEKIEQVEKKDNKVEKPENNRIYNDSENTAILEDKPNARNTQNDERIPTHENHIQGNSAKKLGAQPETLEPIEEGKKEGGSRSEVKVISNESNNTSSPGIIKDHSLSGAGVMSNNIKDLITEENKNPQTSAVDQISRKRKIVHIPQEQCMIKSEDIKVQIQDERESEERK